MNTPSACVLLDLGLWCLLMEERYLCGLLALSVSRIYFTWMVLGADSDWSRDQGVVGMRLVMGLEMGMGNRV